MPQKQKPRQYALGAKCTMATIDGEESTWAIGNNTSCFPITGEAGTRLVAVLFMHEKDATHATNALNAYKDLNPAAVPGLMIALRRLLGPKRWGAPGGHEGIQEQIRAYAAARAALAAVKAAPGQGEEKGSSLDPRG